MFDFVNDCYFLHFQLRRVRALLGAQRRLKYCWAIPPRRRVPQLPALQGSVASLVKKESHSSLLLSQFRLHIWTSVVQFAVQQTRKPVATNIAGAPHCQILSNGFASPRPFKGWRNLPLFVSPHIYGRICGGRGGLCTRAPTKHV